MKHCKILLTGASRGIGMDICKSLLEKGYKVLSISRKKPNIKHKNLKFKKVNLSNIQEIIKNKHLFDEFKPNHIISNAGDLGEIGDIKKVNLSNWIKSFNLNLFSHVLLSQYSLKYVSKNKGKMIFLAGGGSASSFPHFSAYSVSKTALVRFVENLADENKGKIISNIISPGPIYTDLMKKSFQHGHYVNNKKIITSEKCVELIHFLLINKKTFFNGLFLHSKDEYIKFTKNNIKGKYYLRRIDGR